MQCYFYFFLVQKLEKMSAIKPEELIEEVRKYPVLYDQTKEQYRNSDYKDMVWKKVSKELTNVEGKTINT